MIDYSIYYRRAIKTDRISLEIPEFDIFISAFNSSDRVKKVFNDIQAVNKIWFIQPEYQFKPIDYPFGFPVVAPIETDEAIQVNQLINEIGDFSGKTLCIDITGFMRHTLTFLVAKLAYLGISKFTAIYSEPMFYKKQENTTFTTTTSGTVSAVRGMFGSPNYGGQDYLILSVGYDNKLINEVVNYKDSSIIYPVFAFPSLSPDMFQQSAVCAAKSGDVVFSKEWVSNRRYAPANDPFSTAETIRSIIKHIDKRDSNANIYLSPLSTKVQALGIALYWQLEGKKRGAVSIITPQCTSYARETSEGLKRLWSYDIEFT